MTWSIESAVIRAQSVIAVGMQGVWDVFTHRPAYANDHPIPGCPSASDCRGFGCAGDCSEASEASGYDDDPMVSDSYLRYHDDTPNPTEPGLTDDELVGVRGLLQERYDPNRWSRKALDDLSGSFWCRTHGNTTSDCPKDCGTRLFRAAACDPSLAVSAAMGTSGEAVSGATPPVPPASPCIDPPQHTVPAVRGEGSPADSGLQQSPAGEQPRLDWVGWATPAVLEVLSEHYFRWADHSSDGPKAHCSCGVRPIDQNDWVDHVAPEIVARIGCDPARAIAALHNHKPPK